MLESLIEYLNALITPLGFRTYGLTHLVEKEDISFPAIYERKGEFSPMDGEVPTVYHRLLDGPNDTDDPEDESPVNNPIVTRTYSMRAVAVFPFDLYGDDNQYQEDKVIRNLNNQLKQRNIKTLRASLKLIEVSSQPGASARGTDVWEEEFAGIDWKGKRRIVSVDYDVTFRGFADCVATIGCGEGEIDVTQAIIDEYCPECEETPCDPASITTNGDSPALSVASGASQDIAIHDTAGADVGTRSGTTVTVGDTTVTVNSSAYGTTEAETTFNVEVVDDGDSPVGSLSGGKWVVPAGSGPVGEKLMKTGQTTIYATGDDGDLQEGRATDFFTLASNNPFGNTNRFTDELGGPSFATGIVIDWSTYDGSTVLGWAKSPIIGNITWANAITAAASASYGSYSSGWRLPNIVEHFYLMNWGDSAYTNYAPFGPQPLGAKLWWTSSSQASNTAVAWIIRESGVLSALLKTSNGNRYQPVRTFTVTGTTLT